MTDPKLCPLCGTTLIPRYSFDFEYHGIIVVMVCPTCDPNNDPDCIPPDPPEAPQ